MTSSQPHTALKSNILYAGLQGFYWVSICSYFSFMILFLKEYHYSNVQISLIMTMMAFITTIVPPLGGYITDFFLSAKKIVSGCIWISIPLAFMLKFTVTIMPLAVLSIFFMSFLMKGLGTIIDSWGVKLQQQGVAINYGITRGIASGVYALAAVLFGLLFDTFGLQLMFYLYVGVAALAGTAALLLQDVPVASSLRQKNNEDSIIHIIKSLSKNRIYVLLVLAMILHGISLAAMNTLQPIYITQLGGANTHLGLLLFVNSMSEVPLMCFFSKISKKFNTKTLVLIGLIGGVARLFVLSLVTDLPMLISVQAIQAISYGLYFPATLLFACKITNPRITATAITLCSALGFGLSGMIGNTVAGVLSENMPMPQVLFLFSLVNVAGVLVFLGTFIHPKKPADRIDRV